VPPGLPSCPALLQALTLVTSPRLRLQQNPSLGGTINNHLKEWLRNQSWPNHFPSPFPLNVFTTIIGFFFNVYPLHALKYVLKSILD
jgi:hypothetical protein